MNRIDTDLERGLALLEKSTATEPSEPTREGLMKPPEPFAEREPTPGDWALCKSCMCILSGNPSRVVAEGIGNIADAYLLVDAKKTAKERDCLRAVLRGICSELYGQGFKVSGWHQNGDLEPLESWFDDNGWCEAIAKAREPSCNDSH